MNSKKQIPRNHPMLVAWGEFRNTPEFASLRRYAQQPDTLDGALWSIFEAGWVSRRVLVTSLLDASPVERAAIIAAMGEPYYRPGLLRRMWHWFF